MEAQMSISLRSNNADPATAGSPDVPSRALVPFLLLTFAISWGLIGLLLAAPEVTSRWLGSVRASHPFFVLAVWAPAIAAGVVVVRDTGINGLGRFMGRFRLWRAPLAWWGFLVLGVPAVFYLGALLGGTDPVSLLPAAGPWELLLTAAFMLMLGPVEEPGWRGVALPILQRRLAPLWAGLTVGLIWGLWHIPAFILVGTVQSGWSFTPFLAGTVAASVIMTGLVNAARGSLLVPTLFHYQMINPAWPDARPWDSVLLVVVAVAVVVHQRASMLGPGRGVTQVVPAPANPNTEEMAS